MTPDIAARTESLLRSWARDPSLAVTDARPVAVGGSRETWIVEVRSRVLDARRLVVRLDQPGSLLGDNRATEYAITGALADHGDIPVARPLLSDDDTGWFGVGVMVAEWVPGVASKAGLLAPAFDGSPRRRFAEQMFEVLGRLAAIDPDLDLPDHGLATEHPGALLGRWEARLDAVLTRSRPVLAAARRWLHRNVPDPGRTSVVHGDYRVGNLLGTADRGLTAVLDWELAHLGDPLEDLAYACLPTWQLGPEPGLVAAALPVPEAEARWTSASGLPVDPEVLRWWTVFAYLRLGAILWTGVASVPDPVPTSTLYAAIGVSELPRYESALLEII